MKSLKERQAAFLRNIADNAEAKKDASRILPKMFWADDDEACCLNYVEVVGGGKVVAEIQHYYCDTAYYDEEGNPEEIYSFWIEKFKEEVTPCS